MASQQFVDRQSGGLTLDVPQRDVDGGEGGKNLGPAKTRGAPTHLMAQSEHFIPELFVVEGIAPQQHGF